MTLLGLAVSGRGVVPPDTPVLRADDDALLRGRAAFETLRVYGGRPFRLEAHLDRLAGSAARLGLEPVPAAELEELSSLALAEAARDEVVLRLYWTAGSVGLALVSELPEGLRAAPGAGPAARGPARPDRRGALAARRRQVHELRGEHGRDRRGSAQGRRRRGLRQPGRDRARGADHEPLVAARRDALHALARARDPRRRDPRDAARACRAAGGRGRLPARASWPPRTRRSPRRPCARSCRWSSWTVARSRAAKPRPRFRRRSERPPGGKVSAWKRRFASAGWRSGTACSCTGRPRGPAPSASPTGRSRSRPHARASAPRESEARSCAAPPRLLEAMLVLPAMRRELPEARLPFERKGVLGAMLATAAVTRVVRSSRLRPLAKELDGRCGRPGAGGTLASRRRARRLPRRRARRDRELRARRPRDEGARALRLAPRRPDHPHHGDRQLARRPRAGAPPRPRACRLRRRRARRCDRDVRLDGASSRTIPSPALSPGPGTSSSTASRPRSRAPSSSRSPSSRSPPA